MATEKRKPGKARKTPQVDAEAASLSPFMRLAATLPEQTDFPTLLAKQGLAPEIGTVVYIHGINNKPVASVLKCQWDSALFGAAMGDRTRMAYWVNRSRYPVPSSESCAAKDGLPTVESGPGSRGLAARLGKLTIQGDRVAGESDGLSHAVSLYGGLKCPLWSTDGWIWFSPPKPMQRVASGGFSCGRVTG